jgi:hypothetical protein
LRVLVPAFQVADPLFPVVVTVRAFCLLLKSVQSVHLRRPVEVALAFPMVRVTFGQTVAFVPFVMVMDGLVEVKLPNVRAFCFVAIFPERVAIAVSWRVLLPWSFWNAERIESAEVTVPDDARKPVRREVRLSLLLKVL